MISEHGFDGHISACSLLKSSRTRQGSLWFCHNQTKICSAKTPKDWKCARFREEFGAENQRGPQKSPIFWERKSREAFKTSHTRGGDIAERAMTRRRLPRLISRIIPKYCHLQRVRIYSRLLKKRLLLYDLYDKIESEQKTAIFYKGVLKWKS